MKLDLKIVLSDGSEIRTTTGYADAIALEEKYGIKQTDFAPRPVIGPDGKQVIGVDGEPLEQVDIAASWLAFLAYNSLRRRKDVSVSFDEWRESIEELELVQGEDSPN